MFVLLTFSCWFAFGTLSRLSSAGLSTVQPFAEKCWYVEISMLPRVFVWPVIALNVALVVSSAKLAVFSVESRVESSALFFPYALLQGTMCGSGHARHVHKTQCDTHIDTHAHFRHVLVLAR